MINIKNLNVKFKNETVFENFSLTIHKGQKLAITGKSGKGKSTLLNLIAGFIPDFKGQIYVNGIVLNPNNICEIRKLIAWLPQETALNFNLVNDLFLSPFKFNINKKRLPDKKQIAEIFEYFELSEQLLKKKVKEISGGQKQRILLASCILLKKTVLLLDEPTSALDKSIKKKITDYIFSQKDMTIIAATHDDYWYEKSDKVMNLI